MLNETANSLGDVEKFQVFDSGALLNSVFRE